MDWLYFRRLPATSIASLEYAEEEEEEDFQCLYCGEQHGPVGMSDEEAKTQCREPSNCYTEFSRLSQEEDEKIEGILPRPQAFPTTKLYFFADVYDVPALRRAIIDYFWYSYDVDQELTNYGPIIVALRNLPLRSPLCRLWVDQYVDRYRMVDDYQMNCPRKTARKKLDLMDEADEVDRDASAGSNEGKRAGELRIL